MKNTKDSSSFKWGKDTEHKPDKVPITAALFPSSQLQQQQKISEKPLSSLHAYSRPVHNVTHDSSHTDSGMYSTSYLSMNGDSERHEVLSHDKSAGGLEFFPLHAVLDNDRSIISGQVIFQS